MRTLHAFDYIVVRVTRIVCVMRVHLWWTQLAEGATDAGWFINVMIRWSAIVSYSSDIRAMRVLFYCNVVTTCIFYLTCWEFVVCSNHLSLAIMGCGSYQHSRYGGHIVSPLTLHPIDNTCITANTQRNRNPVSESTATGIYRQFGVHCHLGICCNIRASTWSASEAVERAIVVAIGMCLDCLSLENPTHSSQHSESNITYKRFRCPRLHCFVNEWWRLLALGLCDAHLGLHLQNVSSSIYAEGRHNNVIGRAASAPLSSLIASQQIIAEWALALWRQRISERVSERETEMWLSIESIGPEWRTRQVGSVHEAMSGYRRPLREIRALSTNINNNMHMNICRICASRICTWP